MDNIIFYIKKYGKDFLTFLLIFIIIGLLIYQKFTKEEKNTTEIKEIAIADKTEIKKEVTEEKETEDTKVSKVYVDVKGAVKKPGVYEVNSTAIIYDVITMAGGFNSNAFQNSINLSMRVKNEMVLFVYTKEEVKEYEEESLKKVVPNECIVTDYDIRECTQDKQSVIVPENTQEPIVNEENNEDNNVISNDAEKPSVPKSDVININTASIDELTAIKGIGEVKARDIIDYRITNGTFKTKEEIMNVSGIGEKTFEKIKDYITV